MNPKDPKGKRARPTVVGKAKQHKSLVHTAISQHYVWGSVSACKRGDRERLISLVLHRQPLEV